MINSTDGYKKAIVADARRILLRAIIDIISPDIVINGVEAYSESKYSNRDQLYDKKFDDPKKYITLEDGRWLLDGTWQTFPQNITDLTLGYMSDNLSDENGNMNEWVELQFSNVNILQACSQTHFYYSFILFWYRNYIC